MVNFEQTPPVFLLSLLLTLHIFVYKAASTHFMPLVSLSTPRKRQKTRGFLTFSCGIESDQWHEMG